MQTVTEALMSLYNFRVPDAFREMENRGWFNVEDQWFAGQQKTPYLWLDSAEWLAADQITSYEPVKTEKARFIPFAFTPWGDVWCWWPEARQDLDVPVVEVPHDFHLASVYAPHFLGFVYRQVLSYARVGTILDDEEHTAREFLQDWHYRFAEFLPYSWSETILSIANRPLVSSALGAGFISEDEYDELVKRDLAFLRLNEEFEFTSEDSL